MSALHTEQFRIEFSGIGAYLEHHSLRVPRFQRSFAWEPEQVDELLSDIFRAMESGESEYFIGSIVVAMSADGEPEVVDGQQRLATISILLAVIRNHFVSTDMPAADDIDTFLQKKARRSQISAARLRLNGHDNGFYGLHILSRNAAERQSAKATRLSHQRIQQGRASINDRIVKWLEGSAAPADRLHDLVDYLESAVKAIFVIAPSHANAFMIFETLNDRGLALAPSDLLKNYLFHKAGNRIDEAQASWIAMYSLFEAAGNEKLVVDFVRQVWSSKYGLTRERELYDKIKEKITGRDQAIDFAKTLEQSARLYQAMVNTDHVIWEALGPAAQHAMRQLNALGVTRIRPRVMAVLEDFTPAEARKALRLMVSWAVRFMITGGLGTGTLEEYYCLRAKDIRDKTIRGAADLRTAMKTLVPNDEKFRAAFATATVSRKPLARYLLSALERGSQGDPQPELVVNENKEEVNLEHILPETPSPAWKISPDIAEAHRHRIGNLALIRERLNVTIANKGPLEKAKYYKTSALTLTSALATQIEKARGWGPKEINARQETLAEYAVRTWTLKF